MKRLSIILVASQILACSEAKNADTSTKSLKRGGVLSRMPPALPDSSRFKKVRKLLGKDPDSAVRAYHLYPLVEPVCTSTKTRTKFVADAGAYVSVREDPVDRSYARRLAIDTLEHVATVCWRNGPPAAFQILTTAKKLISDTTRFDVITARLKAASGDFEEGLVAAQLAMDRGSIHAIALTANIHAQIARQASPHYTAGMLDKAISIVSLAPGASWPLIDLTAVLSTRARLLAERASWESGDVQKETLRQARNTLGRLSVSPFIKVTRRHALDSLCYDSVIIGSDSTRPCHRAATEFQNLGGAMISGKTIESTRYDKSRFDALVAVRKRLDDMKSGHVVIVAVRGDEHEVMAWTRPAATVLARLQKSKPTLIVIDRTYSKRASGTLDRIIELSGLKPTLRIQAGRDTFAMPCLTALIAGRKAPRSCPFDKALIQRLIKMPPFEFAFLVGRDLDAEIDDLRLYKLDGALLSYRKSLTKNGVDAHLKDLSDAWILAPNAEKIAGSTKANVKP